ncbi:MAG: hypothetical protein RRZ84_02410 [Romboutsia sp.]
MGVTLRNYSLICNQGTSGVNEDVIGITPFGAWVLDGATGLNKKNLVSKESDAKWYVNWWDEYLYKNISSDKSLKVILGEGIELVTKVYKDKLNNVDIEKLDMPSSSICIIKYHEKYIEYLILGDCSLFIKNREVNVIKDARICKFDDSVFEKMNSLEGLENMSFDDIKSSVMDLIISNRLKRNTPDGYWILEFDKNAIENSIYGYIEIENDTKIMITSDGLSSIANRYDIFEEIELIDLAEKFGIQYIYDKLRKFETEDYKTIKFPRFKVKDDSSCIYLHIDKN